MAGSFIFLGKLWQRFCLAGLAEWMQESRRKEATQEARLRRNSGTQEMNSGDELVFIS